MTVNMEIGLVTPPVGLNLFVTANVAELPIERVVVAIMPWLGALLAVLLLVTYVPALSLALPNWVAGMSR
jgi:C4-dicarboxylate transporter DctM subunit